MTPMPMPSTRTAHRLAHPIASSSECEHAGESAIYTLFGPLDRYPDGSTNRGCTPVLHRLLRLEPLVERLLPALVLLAAERGADDGLAFERVHHAGRVGGDVGSGRDA